MRLVFWVVNAEPDTESSPSDAPTGSSKRVPSARTGNGSEMPSTPAYGFPSRNVRPKSVLLVFVVVEL